MSILVILLYFIIWGVVKIYQESRPIAPPVDNWDVYMLRMNQCKTVREKRKFAKEDAKRRLYNANRNKNNDDS